MEGLSSWGEVNQGMNNLARSLGMGSPTDAWVNAALDRLAEAGLDIPTEAEALAYAAAREAAL
jgi:hypothetical protein